MLIVETRVIKAEVWKEFMTFVSKSINKMERLFQIFCQSKWHLKVSCPYKSARQAFPGNIAHLTNFPLSELSAFPQESSALETIETHTKNNIGSSVLELDDYC